MFRHLQRLLRTLLILLRVIIRDSKTIERAYRERETLLEKLIIFWPTTGIGIKLRESFYRRQLKSLGGNPTFESGIRFGAPHLVDVGENCVLGRNVHLNAGECKGIYLGNNVAIADGTYFRSGNHSFDRLDVPIQSQGHNSATIDFEGREYSIVVEDNVWIGARAIILSGAHIGEGSVISAGAVVSSKVQPYSVVVGNPGRTVSNRKRAQTR